MPLVKSGSRSSAPLRMIILLILGSLSFPATVNGQSRPIEYTVSLVQPQTQMVDIAMLVRNVAGPTLDVALPVWRPGRYALIDPSGTVRDVNANASGRSLGIEKLDKTTWRIDTAGASEIEVRYRIYANSLGDRTRHVDDTHAFLSGSSVFFYVPGRLGDEILVRIEAPARWEVATGLEPLGSDPRVRVSPDYHVLIDSPLEIGIHDTLAFDIDGTPHEIVIWGRADYDAERLKEDFARIVRRQAEVFGDMPYDRYVFLIHVGAGAGGGTEHLNSTIMQTARRSLEDDDAYENFLGLVSHEMFHTWNVKQLRPAGINPYDYRQENYTKLLWVAEGTTSYYDDLTLTRIGVLTPDDYLDTMSNTIDTLRNRPGAAVQSLEEASFDAWIKYTKPTPDSVNSTVSFYNGGAMASLLLDTELRTRTDNQATLDDVMRQLYRDFPLSGTGFTPEDVVAAFDALSGTDFDPLFERYIRGTDRYPLEEAVHVLGLELVFEPDADDDRGEADNSSEAAEKPYAGLNLSTRGGATVVGSVLSDGPAYPAGIISGDRVVAVDGFEVSVNQFARVVEGKRPGDTITLHLLRYGQLRTIDFVLTSRPAGRWKLRRLETPTDDQKAAYESWLGQPWPGDGGPR